MKQILDNIVGLTTKVSDLFHDETSNSHNKNENNFYFYGQVNFFGKQPKKIKTKLLKRRSPKRVFH